MMEIGDEVLGSQFYGKKNTLTGTITKIEESKDVPYRGNDIITVEWDNDTTARFYRKGIHTWESPN